MEKFESHRRRFTLVIVDVHGEGNVVDMRCSWQFNECGCKP